MSTPTGSEGVKYDAGKLRYDLVPVRPLRLLAEVYSMGAKKYADRNWEKGIAYTRILGALMRHLEAYRAGESIDAEGGQHHLASVAWCAFALMEYEITHPELDDRPVEKQPSQSPTSRTVSGLSATVFGYR